MLYHLDEAGMPALLPLLDRRPEQSVRIRALLQAYGTGRGFFCVWVQDGCRACIARLESSFFLVDLGGADYEEAAFFLEFNPFFTCLAGEAEAISRAAVFFSSPCHIRRNRLMRWEGPPPPCGSDGIDRRPDLKEVYRIMTAQFPLPGGFAPWYTDLSHRIRHGCARAYLMREAGRPVSTCLVSAESPLAGLISAVTTLPDCRGRGYASALLAAACADLRDAGRRPVLECREAMIPFYERLGFEEDFDVAELHMRNPKKPDNPNDRRKYEP